MSLSSQHSYPSPFPSRPATAITPPLPPSASTSDTTPPAPTQDAPTPTPHRDWPIKLAHAYAGIEDMKREREEGRRQREEERRDRARREEARIDERRLEEMRRKEARQRDQAILDTRTAETIPSLPELFAMIPSAITPTSPPPEYICNLQKGARLLEELGQASVTTFDTTTSTSLTAMPSPAAPA